MKWSWEFIKSIEAITYNVKLSCFFILGGILLGRLIGYDASMYCFCVIIGCIVLCMLDIIRNWMVAIILSNFNKTAQAYLDELDKEEEKNDKEIQ